MAAGVLYLFTRFLPEGVATGRTVAFTAIVMLEMVRVTMVRAQYKLSFFSNPYLIGAVILSVLLQIAVVYVPAMNIVFKTTALALYHWVYILAVMAVMFFLGKLVAKQISR
jgi:Ca2+-transporting ATPase